jgi:RNA polymerase sigma factor (sigma-70 family)
MHETSFTLDHLLANAAWARRLARRLTGNPDDGDDLVQDALLSGLERPTAPTGAARPWLTALVTNLFRSKLRSDRRRISRERSSARPVSDDSREADAEQTLAGLQVHRLLAELVADLPEPYRQTVTLRYFEDRSAAEIAAMSGVPSGTVRWRLKAGLDQLRARLDERHGERKRWMALLAPFASGSNAPPAAAGSPPILPPATPLRMSLGGLFVVVMVAGGLVLVRGRLFAIEQPGPTVSRPTSAPGPQPPAGRPLPAFVSPAAADTLAGCTRRIEDLRSRERDLLMKVEPLQLPWALSSTPGFTSSPATVASAGSMPTTRTTVPNATVSSARSTT